MSNTIKAGASAALVAIALTSAPVVRANGLLSAADEAQLAGWLGAGSVVLTNIYTKSAGDTAADFHRAADGKGATIAVMEAKNSVGQTWLVGGYNPQSWSTKGDFNVTQAQHERTAFLFNLTTGAKHGQTPATPGIEYVGAYQTYNALNYGPTFGIGNDLYVSNDLSHGFSLLYSYADPSLSNSYTSLLDGSPFAASNVTYGKMEVYSVTLAAVPEPGEALMLLAGLGLLAVVRRRKRPLF